MCVCVCVCVCVKVLQILDLPALVEHCASVLDKMFNTEVRSLCASLCVCFVHLCVGVGVCLCVCASI